MDLMKNDPTDKFNGGGVDIISNNPTNDSSLIPRMLTVKETAARFGIAQHHARQLALTGKVKAVRSGTKILINMQSVSDYFNNSNLL